VADQSQLVARDVDGPPLWWLLFGWPALGHFGFFDVRRLFQGGVSASLASTVPIHRALLAAR
jgi:hypothetical protein